MIYGQINMVIIFSNIYDLFIINPESLKSNKLR